ncbi:MAG: hypothetical protein ACXAC6_11090 [Candidatus Hodarchaeales archaeon]|jgi:hypothetical protein
MNTIFSLSSGMVKNFTREKTITLLLILFPVLMVVIAVASAPDGSLPIEIDGVMVLPPPSGEVVAVLLYSMTSAVFVTSITSFFVSFQLRSVVPRLRVLGYSNFKIAISFVLIIVMISGLTTLAVTAIGSLWVTPRDWAGYIIALFFGAIIFSTIGLIIAELVDSKELGLYLILTLGIIDTAFLENPVYSRRYNDSRLSFMPGHEPIQMLLRSTFDVNISWISNLLSLLLYQLILIGIYLLIRRRR